MAYYKKKAVEPNWFADYERELKEREKKEQKERESEVLTQEEIQQGLINAMLMFGDEEQLNEYLKENNIKEVPQSKSFNNKKDIQKPVIYSNQEKIKYYKNRINDMSLTEKQRQYAKERVKVLCNA